MNELAWLIWYGPAGLDICRIETNFLVENTDQIKQIDDVLRPFVEQHCLWKIVIERSKVWCSKTQKRLDQWQYQTFTNLNPQNSTPKSSVKEAIEAVFTNKQGTNSHEKSSSTP